MSLTPGVMLVTGAYFPEISSGGQQCRAVARVLADRVRFVVLSTAVDRTLPVEADVEGVRVYRVPIDVADRGSRLSAALQLARVMLRARRSFDVVHIHGVSSKNVPVTLLARLLGKRIVLTLHTAGQDEPTAVRARGPAAMRAFLSADLVMSVSPVLSDRYRDANLPPDKLRQTINGIDSNRFRPVPPADRPALRQSLGLPDARTILFVGFFSHDKRPETLFDAWLEIVRSSSEPPALVFVGATASPYFEIDAALAPRLVRRAETAGVTSLLRFVEFTNDIERYYQAADLFALPSVREALPMALLEAMSCALPVVATRLGGATDTIVEHGANGLLVPPDDPSALASALASLLSDAPRAAALGAQARATIEARYSIDRAAQDWLDAYEEVLRR